MGFVSMDGKCFHLGLGHFDTRFVLVRVEDRLHSEPALRFCGPDEIDDRLIIDQRLSFPSQTDEREQACFILAMSIWSDRPAALRAITSWFVISFAGCCTVEDGGNETIVVNELPVVPGGAALPGTVRS
jgi:hypothetical protein